ncbi:hypothetical protein ABH926_009992 [Catenulispora sp. GP43]
MRDKLPFLILDGTLVPIDWVEGRKASRKGHEIDAWHSGKTHEFAGNI